MHESTCWLVLQEVPLFFRDELTSTLIFKLKYSLMLSLYAESKERKRERERRRERVEMAYCVLLSSISFHNRWKSTLALKCVVWRQFRIGLG